MKRMTLTIAFVLAAVLAALPAHAKKAQVFRVQGGTPIQDLNLVIEASYDPRLDSLAPGYKVINVALINQSFNVLFLDPEKDKWQVRLANDVKPVTAVHDLRREDPKAWNAMPERARNIIGYPLALPIGGREVLDLFIPESVDLSSFNELDVTFRAINARIEVLVRQ